MSQSVLQAPQCVDSALACVQAPRDPRCRFCGEPAYQVPGRSTYRAVPVAHRGSSLMEELDKQHMVAMDTAGFDLCQR